MNHKNIMNQLTTNLSFRTAVAKPAVSCKLLLKNVAELPQPDPAANATLLKPSAPQADNKPNEITILNGITNNVQTKSSKAKKKVDLKNLAQINKEKVSVLSLF